jgi:hypothetical protein
MVSSIGGVTACRRVFPARPAIIPISDRVIVLASGAARTVSRNALGSTE